MDLQERIDGLVKLRQQLKKLTDATLTNWADKAANENRWFTRQYVQKAIEGIVFMLEPTELHTWTQPYKFGTKPRQVGIIMAGNIPLVGFHDLLSVLVSGHKALVKLSSQDKVLLPLVTDLLIKVAPTFKPQLMYVDKLSQTDAVIATGSDNTARYFEQYFKHIPHIIRKNRTSCAVLTGDETDEDLHKLGEDVFTYYGLGCRNVSKLFVPNDYNFTKLLDLWNSFSEVAHHSKWQNNYDYNKSIYLVNKVPHLDTGFLILKESEELVSPLAVLFYQHYTDMHQVVDLLSAQSQKIQCVVGQGSLLSQSIAFGQAQYPGVQDYADGIDTLAFLESLT